MYNFKTSEIDTINRNNIVSNAEVLERYKTMILAAASDFRKAYGIIGAALELAKEKPEISGNMDALKAEAQNAYGLSKHLESIADFSDSVWSATCSITRMYKNNSFCENLWQIEKSVEEATDILIELGVRSVSEANEDADEETVLWDDKKDTPRDVFAHVLHLRRHMAQQSRVIDPAGSLCSDMDRLYKLRQQMINAFNFMIEPDIDAKGLEMSENDYNKCLPALSVAIQAASILIENGNQAFCAPDCGKAWGNYCRTDEARDANTAICIAMDICSLNLF